MIINCQRERPLFFTEWEWAQLQREAGCEDPPYASVSVGHGDVPVFKSGPGIPQMVSRPGTGPSRPSNQTIAGGVSTSVPRVIPSDVGTTGPVVKPGDTERITNQQLTEKGEYMDAGDVLGGIKTAVDIWKTIKSQPVMSTRNSLYQENTTDGLFGVPFVDVIPEATSDSKRQVWDPRANCGKGKWITKHKRRRKRLATASDIKDLSALKSVLGAGKGLDTWIATH